MKQQRSGGLRIKLGWVLFVLVLLALIFGAESMWVRDGASSPPAEVVQTQRVITAFTSIPADAIVLASAIGPVPAQALTDPAQAAGRVALTDLPAKTALTATNSLPIPDGWHILAAPISPTLAVQPGETLILLGIDPDEAESETISEQALGLGQQDDVTLLVLPISEARRAAAYLIGDRSLALLRPIGVP